MIHAIVNMDGKEIHDVSLDGETFICVSRAPKLSDKPALERLFKRSNVARDKLNSGDVGGMEFEENILGIQFSKRFLESLGAVFVEVTK